MSMWPMRAAVLEQPGSPLVVHSDVEIEEPRAGEVAVRVSHCGVCHSDLSVADGTFPAPMPVVLGHEGSGIVEAVGAGVRKVKVGDRLDGGRVAAIGESELQYNKNGRGVVLRMP